jgi:hypothetical protein
MALPNRFQTISEVFANYDYFDLFRQIGYKRFYLCGANSSTANTYFLTTETINSDPTSINYNSNNTALQLRNDTDFDLNISKSLTIGGDLLLNFTIYQTEPADLGKFARIYLTINIYRVSAVGTETLLATETTDTLETDTSGGSTNYRRCCLKMNVADTNLAKGEKLRVNVLHYHESAGIANSSTGYYFDPSSFNSVGGYDTDFVVIIPFKIFN